MARLTKGRVVCYYQDKGARVHFNDKKIDDINLKYGVIQYDDVVRDLRYWETLLSSSLMQRPYTNLLEDKISDELLEA